MGRNHNAFSYGQMIGFVFDVDRGIAIYNLNKGIKWRYPLGHFFAFVKGRCGDVSRYFFNNGFTQNSIGYIVNYFYYNMDF